MKNSFQKNAGIQKLRENFKKAFRIPENLNYYSPADFRVAERKFIRHCLRLRQNGFFTPDHTLSLGDRVE